MEGPFASLSRVPRTDPSRVPPRYTGLNMYYAYRYIYIYIYVYIYYIIHVALPRRFLSCTMSVLNYCAPFGPCQQARLHRGVGVSRVITILDYFVFIQEERRTDERANLQQLCSASFSFLFFSFVLSGKKLDGRTRLLRTRYIVFARRDYRWMKKTTAATKKLFCTVGINNLFADNRTGDIGVTGFFAPCRFNFRAQEVGGKSDLFILWSGCDRFKELDELSGISRWNNGIAGWSEHFCYRKWMDSKNDFPFASRTLSFESIWTFAYFRNT